MSEKIKFKISDFRIGMEVETPIGMGKIYLIEQSENIKVKIEVPPNYCLTKQLYPFSKLKPVLRTLDTMTDEEAIEIGKIEFNADEISIKRSNNYSSEFYNISIYANIDDGYYCSFYKDYSFTTNCEEFTHFFKIANYLEKKGFTFAGYSANELIEKGQAVKK